MEETTITIGNHERSIEELVPAEAVRRVEENQQKAVPALAKDADLVDAIEEATQRVPTSHRLILGDSRYMESIPDDSVHLAVTSPPYWILKDYPERDGQLSVIEDYEEFLKELDRVWEQVFRVLVPGGRLIVVIGDVCLPRKKYGRHVVFPLHSSIQEHCRKLGFDNLAPIIWYKIANAKLEVEGPSSFLGKPYEPNGIIKNDIEYILFQRKPEGYRKPKLERRILSVISEKNHREWFQQIWKLPGARTQKHPAPYPVKLVERLIRMFSFVGDTVLDPFMGTGSTNVAAAKWGRNSIGCDIEPEYVVLAQNSLQELKQKQLRFHLAS